MFDSTSHYSCRRARLLAATVLAAGLALPGLTQAAASNTSETSAKAGPALEEIMVTARKRKENEQQVPDTINTFSAQKIQDAGITSVGDFTSLVTNMSFISSQNKGTESINIRGIGQVRNGEPPVAVVIDGVQISSPNQITQELFDIERIEVLKGPQGALYGRDAIGGAINIITKKPTDNYEGFLRTSLANGLDYKFQGGISGPIVKDKLLFRIAGNYEHDDGLINNVTLGQKVDFGKSRDLRGRLLFLPTETLTFDLRLSYSKFDGGASWYIPLPDGDSNNTNTQVQGNRLGTDSRKIQDYALKTDYDAGFATLTWIASYSRTQEFFFEDLDWLPTPILAAQQGLDNKSWSQELRVTSSSNQRLRWMVGGYYLDTKRDINTDVFLDQGTSLLSIAAPHDAGHNKAAAGYAQLNYDITPQLEATAALRYDSDNRNQHSFNTGADVQHTFDAWQPKFSLAYKWTPGAMTYMTVGRGFRSGGFNQATASFGGLYKAEADWNFEAGFKTEWLNRRLMINGAAFLTKFDNQHVFVLDAATAAQGIININKSTVKGVELEFRALPVEGLELSGGVGLMKTRIDDFNGTSLYVGNQSPLTNQWSYNLSAQYTRDLMQDLSLVARVDYSAKGDLAWHIDNADWQKAYHIVDARLGVDYAGGWNLTVFAKNLFNEKYTSEFFAKEFTGLITDIRWPNEPRRYGVEMSYRF